MIVAVRIWDGRQEMPTDIGTPEFLDIIADDEVAIEID